MELLTIGNYRKYLQVEKWLESKGCTEIFWDGEAYDGQYHYYHYKYKGYYHALIRKIIDPYTIYIFQIGKGEVFDLPVFYHYLKTGKAENVLGDFDELMEWHLKK